MDLDAERGDLAAAVAEPGLDHGGQQVDARLGRGADTRVGVALGGIERGGGRVNEPAHGLVGGLHGHQHAAHVGVADDRHRVAAAAAVADGMALDPLLGVGERRLIGALADRQALQADQHPGVVHHGEHAGHAPVLLAHEVTDRAARIAVGHDAGRRGVDAELVLERDAAQVVARARRAVRAGQELGHDKNAQTLGAGGRVGRAGEDHVDDVLGTVVLAPGDEDLLTGDEIVIAVRHGPGLERAHVRAGLGFGQFHGPGPGTRDQLGQVGRLLRLGAMGLQQFDRALGQHRRQREAQVR